eukprot:1530741-Rhodomonas_salina.2
MEKGTDVPMVALDHWGASVVDSMNKMVLDSSTVREGIQIVQAEIDSMLGNVRETVRVVAASALQIAKDQLLICAQASLRNARQRWCGLRVPP